MIANLDLPTKNRTWSSRDHDIDRSILSEPVMDFIEHYNVPSIQIVHTNNSKLDSFDGSLYSINTGAIYSYRTSKFLKKILESHSAYLELSQQLEKIIVSKPSYIDKNLFKIKKIFAEKLEKYHCKDFSKDVIRESFESISMYISTLKFVDILIFINNSNKIKFSISFSQNRVLVINKSFELINDFNDDNLIIFSLFIDDELVASGVNEISKFIDGFKKYLDS
ncbi:hypothetical protein ACFFLS_05860 [Flavobacterium procerum]|uniref:Uncharacterized protein n=1 Tax=Flavobacterium procerum TaxID=1455569 RepID=A0ABV6BM84_9FLAO